jgi:hypothetical protein
MKREGVAELASAGNSAALTWPVPRAREFGGADVAGSAVVPQNWPGGGIWSINGAGGFDRRAAGNQGV